MINCLSKRLPQALLVLLLGLCVGPTFAAAVVSVAPAASTQTVGDTFTLNIDVSAASDVYAYEFDIGFDPGLLRAVSSHEGAFLATAGTTVFIPGAIDNGLGAVGFVSGSLIGPISGAHGSGTLATVTFAALAKGVASISLSNLVLLDSSLGVIANVESAGGRVQVNAVSSVPEPATGVLAAIGLLALWVRRRVAPR